MFFSFRSDNTRTRQHRLVLFSISAVNEDDLLDAVQDYCELNSPPDGIDLLTPEPNAEACRNATTSDRFRARMPAISRQLNTPTVHVQGFGIDGLARSNNRLHEIIQAGLVALYRRYNGIIQATAAHHYVKPSLRHCTAFLRTGNVMINGPEIEFIAACCLPFVPEGMSRIYCDTGAIHPIAYAIFRLLAIFGDDRAQSVAASFGSYSHLRELRFTDARNSLVLISASTSGELSKQLQEVEPRFRATQIVTVYYLGDNPEKENHICDLLYHPERNVDGYSRIQSYPADSCPMCREGSTAVPMSGDHFLPEGLTVAPVLIRATDAPQDLSRFIDPLVGKSILRANYTDPVSGSSSKDLFVDLHRAFADKTFLGVERWRLRFETLVAHAVSLDTRRIVCLDDPASQQLANRVLEYCVSLGKSIPVLRFAELQENLSGHSQNGGATLVVASAFATGRQLLGVAQTLRYAQATGAINYAVGLVRPNDGVVLRDVRSHLTYGHNGPDEHGFHVLDQFFFPPRRPDKENSWQRELKVLTDLDLPVPSSLIWRIAEIEQATSSTTPGLLDKLFMPSISGTMLKLRPGFAFWDFNYGDRSVSQGDVFTTIALVLHALRRSGRGNRSLGQYDHVRRVISPRCFERFNDGVIQAALLRAAYPSELDYSINDGLSEEMHDILFTLFSQRTTEVGEAALEFLVALATRQMRLVPTYLKALSEEFAEADDREVWKFYWEWIRSRVL
jgi:hypothetical protein